MSTPAPTVTPADTDDTDTLHLRIVVDGTVWWSVHCTRCCEYLGDEAFEPGPDLLCLDCEVAVAAVAS